ncbi:MULTISPECIES: anhydro-N-acetylmuramic acid kinase [Pasteurellaceae]|uniref:anhydro-N-acetylmuramic acid kinase n=1 Tax=Pasteurellaceae TaxID=712 RepID=UPI0035637078
MNNYYLGIMSGTSLDGVDLALMDFSAGGSRLIAAAFTPMPQEIRAKLTALLRTGQTSLQHLGELDHRLALLYAECVNDFLRRQRLSTRDIQAIGCHGQTVWHAPQGPYPFTMQLGDMNLLAAKTGIAVIGDFRRKDMAYGGQGAPLVPAFHQGLFGTSERVTVVLNIGGISNISVLIPGQPVIGYDTGPGNALMDDWIERHLGKPYDENGRWAQSGQVSAALLQDLLDDPYFALPPPKSTGREWFNAAWLAEKRQKHTALSPCDVQATLLEFTLQSTLQSLSAIRRQTALPCRLLVCGGGAKNPLLMARFKQALPDWTVATTTEYGLDVDYVEAAAFAWLAYRYRNGLAGNLPSVTGAQSAVGLGAFFSPS